jgi:autotransporter family porin
VVISVATATLVLATALLITILARGLLRSGPAPAPGHAMGSFALPPGSVLPGDAQCAARVRRSPWEPRPGNTAANHRVPPRLQIPGFTPDEGGVDARARADADRVTGGFVGTTDEILQWGACKWGFDADTVRAVAVAESSWYQAKTGDGSSDRSACPPGYRVPCPQSFGLLQVKWNDHQGTFPWSRESTAFNVDYALMFRRVCFEGWMTWIDDVQPGAGYGAGDEWSCVGVWYSGMWRDAEANGYIRSVRQNLRDRPWLQPGF